MTPRLGIILFARMSSSRLPGKMLLPLGPTTLFERIVARARVLAHPILLATSSDRSDDPLCEAARQLGVPTFRGSLDDVLGRACEAARTAGFDAFARLCGDRPFLPLDDTRRGLSLMYERLRRAEPCDLVTNARTRPVPPGLTTEVIRTGALERVHAEARSPEEREHLTLGLLKPGSGYAVEELPSGLQDLPRVPLAVDTETDRVRLGRLIEENPAVDLCERVAIRALLQVPPDPIDPPVAMNTGNPKIEVAGITAEEALRLWHDAPRTTVFTHPDVLGTVAHGVRWWLASESGRPAWVWPVCVDADGLVTPPELCYYVGPFRIGEPDPSPRRRLLRDMAVQHELLKVLTRVHGRLEWSTTPGEHDLRPWLWHEVDGCRPLAVPRYTAVIDGLVPDGEESLLRRFAYDRRHDARAALAMGPVPLPSVDLERIRALYRETLAATGAAEVAERRLGEVDALVEVAGRGHGRVMTFGIGDDGIARAAWIILVGKGRACEVLAASDPAWRKARLNAYGRLHCIMAAQALGASRYDFTGANSPQRGSDKHGYGAEAELYFDLSFRT